MDLALVGFYQQYVLPWALKIIAALAIFIIGKWVARLISIVVGRAMTNAKITADKITIN